MIFGALQQVQDAVAVDRSFAPAHAHHEVLVCDRLELRESLAQRDQIVGRHVIAVALVHFLREPPAFVFLSEAKQILRELDFCRQKTGVELERPTLISRAFREAIFLRQLFADQMVHLRICRPVFQRRFTRLIFLVGVAAQMGQHGPIRPGFRPPGVHGKRLAEHLAGGGILLGIDRVVGQ